MSITVKYSLFALISTIANIGSQDIVTRLYSGVYSVSLSVLVGTAIGLLVKYILDKKYIFRFQIKNFSHETQTFVLYAIVGVVTTGVFWGLEFLFDVIFQVKKMRYLGGILGLTIGYAVKYFLDKKFVFNNLRCIPNI